jgi:hypothetical protein
MLFDLCGRFGEEQPQDCRTRFRKQQIKNPGFAFILLWLTFLTGSTNQV